MDLNSARSNAPVNTANDILSEIVELQNKLSTSPAPIELKEDVMRTIQRLERMAKWGNYSSEFESVDKYVDWVTRIPWGVISEDNLNIENAKELMDSTHYGMDVVKNLILDYLAVMQIQKLTGRNTPQSSNSDMAGLRGSSANAPVLLFLGLQGVGKTSIAKSIAQSMGRKFARVSLGAIGDVRTLRGSPRHEIDSEPGQIIKALVRTGTMNPVILIDEIEKASGNAGLLNDVMAALLEILDSEQNSTFIDHYVDHPVDLSQVFFICTANNLGGLSAALLDRVEIIRFTSYSDEEKGVIAKSYILPKVLKNMGLTDQHIQITQEVWPLLIRPVGFDAGIRQLERNIATLARSAARQIVGGHPLPIVVTPENVKEYVLPDQGPLS
ncbi:MAG: AAA family ATPase [Candidatus Dojkabacteria bacterium]|nr:AAA family ATPase [Candidatus Dojkabacteria bacterium]